MTTLAAHHSHAQPAGSPLTRLRDWCKGWVLPKSRENSDTDASRLYRGVTVALYLAVMASLVGIGFVVLLHSLWDAYSGNQPFDKALPDLLGGLILAVIVLELLETVYKQLVDGERLSVTLVNNFLIIGAVSAVRHILVISAKLSMESIPAKGETSQLYANVVLVAVLLFGIWLVRGMVADEAKNRAS